MPNDAVLHKPQAVFQLCRLTLRMVKCSVCFVGRVTLYEFAEFIIKMWSSGIPLEPHWQPQHIFCNPCYIEFDFIGRFENLKEDVKHVLAKIATHGGKRSHVTFPALNAYGHKVSTSRQLRHFYSDMPRDIVRNLIRIYKRDYELFGYDYRWACSDC